MLELTLEIYKISRCTHNYYARELKKLHLSMGQFPFIIGIAEHDGISQERLSAMLRISKSTTAAIIRQLMDKGLAERETDSADRRNFRLHVTAAGRDLIPKIYAVIEECHRLMLDGLTDIERGVYMDLTQKIRARTEASLLPKSNRGNDLL